jgi:hypothetical protein
MNNSLTEIAQLRNNIDFASTAQFFHTFQSAFRPWPVTTHDIIYSRASNANEYIFETEVKLLPPISFPYITNQDREDCSYE